MDDQENKSAEPFVPPPTDVGGKVEPSVTPDRLIARLMAHERQCQAINDPTDFFKGYKRGISRAIKIIQANEGS